MRMIRGTWGAVTALAMLAASLGAVLTTASAAQALGEWPEQCVETLSDNSPPWMVYDSQVWIQDVNVIVRSSRWAEVGVYLTRNGTQQVQLSDPYRMGEYRFSGAEITFDDQASLEHGGILVPGPGAPPPSSVVMRPASRIGDHFPANGEWTVTEQEHLGGMGREIGFMLQVTYSDCDADRDGVPDKQRDNCDGLANPDQRDRDGDGAGDACDGDDDNDGVADASDNCPVVSNGDQANFDGDAQGDACDGDDDNDGHPDTGDECPRGYGNPCPPPPPPGTNPGTDPGTNPGTNPGTPEAAHGVRRSVVMKVKRRRVFLGAVASAAGVCSTHAQVRIMRKKKGPDRLVAIKRAQLSGKFKVKRKRAVRPGRYYAQVSRTQALGGVDCRFDRSPVVRVRR